MSLAMLNGPVWRFRGRAYRTITGLYSALFADSGATSISAVVNRRISAATGSGADRKVVATCAVSAPKLGEEMTVTREAS